MPDVHEGETFSNGVMPFPRVSCASESAENADLDPQAAGIFVSPSPLNICMVVHNLLLVNCVPYSGFATVIQILTFTAL